MHDELGLTTASNHSNKEMTDLLTFMQKLSPSEFAVLASSDDGEIFCDTIIGVLSRAIAASTGKY